jgi:hypothetical protein
VAGIKRHCTGRAASRLHQHLADDALVLVVRFFQSTRTSLLNTRRDRFSFDRWPICCKHWTMKPERGQVDQIRRLVRCPDRCSPREICPFLAVDRDRCRFGSGIGRVDHFRRHDPATIVRRRKNGQRRPRKRELNGETDRRNHQAVTMNGNVVDNQGSDCATLQRYSLAKSPLAPCHQTYC